MAQTANVALVKLSGSSDKLYSYLIDHLERWPNPGQRVVVPSKLKEDNTLSLAIGTVENVVLNYELDPAIQYRPIVQVLSDAAIEFAKGSYLPPITGTININVPDTDNFK